MRKREKKYTEQIKPILHYYSFRVKWTIIAITITLTKAINKKKNTEPNEMLVKSFAVLRFTDFCWNSIRISINIKTFSKHTHTHPVYCARYWAVSCFQYVAIFLFFVGSFVCFDYFCSYVVVHLRSHNVQYQNIWLTMYRVAHSLARLRTRVGIWHIFFCVYKHITYNRHFFFSLWCTFVSLVVVMILCRQ